MNGFISSTGIPSITSRPLKVSIFPLKASISNNLSPALLDFLDYLAAKTPDILPS
jgi:hypothetical protein